MTTPAELILQAPDPAHGIPVPQRPAVSGAWFLVLEGADPSAGSGIVWHDLSHRYEGDHNERGSNAPRGRYQPAVITVDLALTDGSDELAPWGRDTTDVFGVNVEIDGGLLMRLCMSRVAGGVTVEWEPIWTGRVETWDDVTLALGTIRKHRVTVVDLIGDLAGVPVPANVEEEWGTRFTNLLTDGGWQFGYDFEGKADLLDIPARDAQKSAITEIDATADPISLEWRTRRNGRLIFHPASWDEEHETEGAWDNPLLEVYPNGITFSYSPDVDELEYIHSEFGMPRSSLGVTNSLAVTMPGGPYPIDDPASIQRYGRKHKDLSWIVDNQPAADQRLAALAYATQQAKPISTTNLLGGFWPAMVMIDHLDPVTVIHATRPGGDQVTGQAIVRRIVEDRTFNEVDGLSWKTSLQLDVISTEVTPALLPPENLRLGFVRTSESIEWLWDNPSGQPVDPNVTQVRALGHSDIWTDIGYPLTSVLFGGLTPSTAYRFQARYVRRVDGVITHVSPIASMFLVSTLAAPGPAGPGPGGGDPGDTEVPIDPPEDGCDLEWELQESDDGVTWSTILTGDQDDLTDNGPGADPRYTLNIDESAFDDGKLYRVRQREVCGGDPGDWTTGPPFDPPDDWADPCSTPSRLSEEPYTL